MLQPVGGNDRTRRGRRRWPETMDQHYRSLTIGYLHRRADTKSFGRHEQSETICTASSADSGKNKDMALNQILAACQEKDLAQVQCHLAHPSPAVQEGLGIHTLSFKSKSACGITGREACTLSGCDGILQRGRPWTWFHDSSLEYEGAALGRWRV